MNDLIFSSINDIYLNKCSNDREKINFVNDIYAIGDLHGDYQILIKILLNFDLIVKTKEYFYNNISFDYKLNDNLSSYALIQVGDQLDGNRHLDYSKTNFKDEDDKIIYFFDLLKEQSKKLNNVYIISIIGNHEFMNLNKIYKYVSPKNLNSRNDFIDNNKKNILCNRYYCIVINNFVFSHCGIIKSLIVNLDLMYPNLNLINNLKQFDNLNDKIDYLDKLIRILMIYKLENNDNNNNDNDDKIKDLLYKFVNARNFYGGKINLDDLKINCNELNNINELFHIDNMVIGHTMQYNGIKNYKCIDKELFYSKENKNISIFTSGINEKKNLFSSFNQNSSYSSNNKNIFIIDTGLSGSFQLKTLKQILHIHFNNKNNLNDYNISFININ